MKKVFKGLSILVASTALCGGIATATACSGGVNGTYYGEYHYVNYSQTYGMVVEVTVENNIITAVKDITNTDNAKAKALQTYKDADDGEAEYHEWHTASAGWETYYKTNYGWLTGDYTGSYKDGDPIPEPSATAIGSYAWTDADVKNWTGYENWLLQQYVGWSVADILDIDVFYSGTGEPYGTKGNYNAELAESKLFIANATQGSGRLMLAVQNALKK